MPAPLNPSATPLSRGSRTARRRPGRHAQRYPHEAAFDRLGLQRPGPAISLGRPKSSLPQDAHDEDALTAAGVPMPADRHFDGLDCDTAY